MAPVEKIGRLNNSQECADVNGGYKVTEICKLYLYELFCFDAVFFGHRKGIQPMKLQLEQFRKVFLLLEQDGVTPGFRHPGTVVKPVEKKTAKRPAPN